MTSRDFCYWLQGFFELRPNATHEISGPQAEMISRHLALVFKHEIDPSIAKPGTPEAAVLDTIHTPNILGPTHGAGGTGFPPGPTYRC